MGDDTTEGRVCSVCRTVLDHRRPIDDPTSEGVWEHTFSYISEFGTPDHEPVPVPAAEFTSLNSICDFCSIHEVNFVYRFKESGFAIVDDRKVLTEGKFSKDWAACSGCARLIDQRNVNGLVARVAAAFKRRSGYAPGNLFNAQLDELYRGLIRTGGPFQKAPITPDDPFGTKGLR